MARNKRATPPRRYNLLQTDMKALPFILLLLVAEACFATQPFTVTYSAPGGACDSASFDIYSFCGPTGPLTEGQCAFPLTNGEHRVFQIRDCATSVQIIAWAKECGVHGGVGSYIMYQGAIVTQSLPGGGCPTNSDNRDKDECPKQDGCCGAVGMPQWSVSEPFTTLWLHDEPLGYQPAVGPRVALQLAFKQHEVSTGIDPTIFSMGQKWNFSWLSYVSFDSNGTNVVLFPGGGQHAFPNGQDMLTNTRLTGNTNSGFTVAYPDGSKDVYGFVLTNNSGTFLKAFMTEHWNSSSQRTVLNYASYYPSSPVCRLLTIVDGDGQTNSISYVGSNAFSTNLISQVVDAYGRSNVMAYDANGLLTNITDVASISSGMTYDANQCVSSLTTPYGTTQFEVADPYGANGSPNGRSILVTQPDGGHQLYLYRDYAFGIPSSYASGELPVTTPYSNTLDNSDMQLRNTFYWGPRQYAALSTTNMQVFTTNDMRKARMKHWLLSDPATVGQTVSMVRDPSPDGGGFVEGQKTWYDYAGKTNTEYEGTQSQQLLLAGVLPDGTTSLTRTDRNPIGAVTSEVSSFSVGPSTLLRTNSYVYSTNNVDLVSATNALGAQVLSNICNTTHQVVTQYNALQERTVFTYNATQQVTSVTSFTGLITTNVYNASGLVAMTYDYAIIGGSSVFYRTNAYTYANSLVATATDPRGLTVTNTWDNLQRLRRVDFPDGSYVTNTYNALDFVRKVDQIGAATTYGYDSMRRKVAETNALGYFKLWSYCTCGSLDSAQDEGGYVSHFFYDNQGKATNIVYADGFSVTNAYNLIGQLTNTVDSAGTSTTNAFNNQGSLVLVSNAVGQVSAIGYDALNRLTNSVDANGVLIAMSYDNLDRITSRSYPDGGVEQIGYSANIVARTSFTNQLGLISTYGYDPIGRTTVVTNANLETNVFTFSLASDMLTLTDGRGQRTSWNYDEYGRITNKVDAANNIILICRYDPNGRLTNRWTPEKLTTTFSYDTLGNLTNAVYPANSNIALAYDMLNRLTNMVDSLGTTRFSYDAAGQLLTEDGPWGDDTVSFAYANRLRTSLSLLAPNATSWVQSYAYDSVKRLTNVTSAAGAFGYSYAAFSNQNLVATISLPNGAFITNTYNANAHLLTTTLKNSTNGTLNAHTYIYNLGSQPTQQVFTAGNYVNYSYDNIGQVKTARGTELNGTTPRQNEQFGYSYDSCDNLNFRTNNSLFQAFNVNSLNELNTVTRTGTLTSSGTTTSPATNVLVNTVVADLYNDNTFARTNLSLADGSNTVTAIGRDIYGRIDSNSVTAYLPVTNTFIYDLNGNLRTNGNQTLQYDDENQLITNWVTGVWKAEFLYDGRHRRRDSNCDLA